MHARLPSTNHSLPPLLTQVLRVFYDRLVDDHDRLWMGGALSGVVEKHFKERIGKVGTLWKACVALQASPNTPDGLRGQVRDSCDSVR